MQYFGGKSKICKDIAKIINANLSAGQLYVEPFCGGLSVTQHIRPDAIRQAGDFKEDLILMYQAYQKGWRPPSFVSEERYKELKTQTEQTPEKAFAGFACSFSAKYFGGYSRAVKCPNFAAVGSRGLAKKFLGLEGVSFFHADFLESNYKNAVIYCDPPYANTTGYKTGAFDSAAFWQKARELSRNNLLLISEYKAPSDFIEVWQKETQTSIRGKEGKQLDRTEKLFAYL